MLRQPINDILQNSQRVLLAGAGGGYDVLGAIPLRADLLAAGKNVHLASLSFCSLQELEGALRHSVHSNLYEVYSDAATQDVYCPEAWLASWLENSTSQRQPVWCFERTGVQPLKRAYQFLVNELRIDTIVLVDGGIDAILRGDEYSLGTPEEDLTSIAAVELLDVPVKVLACVGLGAELRDGVSHAQVFERIAELSQQGGYLGASALLQQSAGCQQYVEAVRYVFANQRRQRRSHIHDTVLEAVSGRFGQLGPYIWYSPLLNLYWFFSAPVVARTHLFLKDIYETEIMEDVSLMIKGNRYEMEIRDKAGIPI